MEVVGPVIGGAAALGLGNFAAGLITEINARDPLTYVAIGTLRLLVGAAASAIPARRAMKVDPMTALRFE